MKQSYHAGAVAQLDLFRDRLPAKPYHTDDLSAGLQVRSAERAALARYIQPNGPTHRFWLVYDIDRPGAAIDWSDRGAPPPSITAKNPENGHAHLIYGLKTSVRTASDAKSAPLRYAAAVDCALQRLLGADLGYSGLICKNPLHPHWQVTTWEPRLYTLADLDSWLDLEPAQDRRKRLPDYGLGRNCNLFEQLRLWAYRAIRQGWPDFEQWQAACLDRALMYNAGFAASLDHQEVRHVARSVAKWTHQHLDAASFSAWQAVQGRKGGKAKGEAYALLRAQALRLRSDGVSIRSIAKELSVGTGTVHSWVSTKR